MNLEKLQYTVLGIFASALAYWVQIPLAFQALLLLQGLDLISGLSKAFVLKQLHSDVGRRGLIRKFQTILIVVAALIAEPLLAQVDTRLYGVPLATSVATYFCIIELLSLAENAGQAGVPVPQFLTNALVKLQEMASGGRNASPSGGSGQNSL